MTIPNFTAYPNSLTSPTTFATDMDTMISEFPAFIAGANALEVAGTLSETQDTSASSNAIGTGAKTFTVTAGKSFAVGMWLTIADTAAPSTNAMYGTVTSYSSTTLVMNIASVIGSGTKTAWTISQSAPGGAIAGVSAGNVAQVDQTVTAWTRAATTTLGTTLNGTLSDTSTTITAFAGVAGVTYHCRCLGAGAITHHATDLIITQSGASIAATAAGDTFDVEMLTATTCRIKNYVKAAALPATLGANTFTGQQTFVETMDTVYGITDGAAFEIDPVNGNIQTITLGDNRTPAATNFAAGQAVLLGIDDGTAYAITWTTVAPTWVKPGGTATAPTLATTGYTWILLWKVSTTIYAAEVGKP